MSLHLSISIIQLLSTGLLRELKSLHINEGKTNPDSGPRLLDMVSDVSFLQAQGFSDFGSILPNIIFSVKGVNLDQTFVLATTNLCLSQP